MSSNSDSETQTQKPQTKTNKKVIKIFSKED
jgi:hypothetical protein